MRHFHIIGLVAALPSAYGVAFGGPAPTDVGPDRALDGTSPAPTRGPSAEDLRRRQSSSQATCGWVNGEFESALTCSVGRTCMLYKSRSLGMAGCCSGRDTQNCGWASSCVDYSSYVAGSCGNSCLVNPLVKKCTNAAAPYCVTWTYPSDGVKDFGCDSTSTNTVYTVRQTARDNFSGSTSTRLPTVTAGAATNPTGSSSTAPSHNTVKKIAIGAIIGIVIAVLAIVFLIIVGVCICLKRKKKKKRLAANAQIIANMQANGPESQFQPLPPPQTQTQIQQDPSHLLSSQSPQPHMSAYFPPPNPQEQKYTAHSSVHEYNTTPISNPTSPAPTYVQPYNAHAAPPGHYQPPANGAHEVASPVSPQSTGQYQVPLGGAHEVPSPDTSHPPQPQPQHVSPRQQSSSQSRRAHEVDASSAPSSTGPVYEMGGT